MLPFHRAAEKDFSAVNDLIIRQLHSDVSLVENIGHYIIQAGGKRLRPLLVLLMARCLNYSQNRHVELAAIIEFIHTATLLHDDVVDMSSRRRGRPTANAEWGNAPSVLVGDFLYSRAFQMLVSLGDMDIMRILSDATNTISEGEVQQLVNAKNPAVTEADYLQVIHKKTAVLFEAACSSAAVLAGASHEWQIGAASYGLHLGMTFQLVDDVLDYEGDAEALGKNIGDDLAEGKPTLPLIFAMQNADPEDRRLINATIQHGGLENLDSIVAIVRKCGALDYTRECAARRANQAQQSLAMLPANHYTQVLSDLAGFSLTREY